MKTADDIQRAHDRLWAIVAGEIDVGLGEFETQIATANLDVLCWVLGHEHNPTFENNLRSIAEAFESLGIVETQAPRPMAPEEFAAWKKSLPNR